MISFLMLTWRETHRFLRVIVQTVVTPFISSLLYLFVFGLTLGSQIEAQQGVHYLAFLIPGLCTMGLMNNAFQNSSSSVIIGKFTGELEDLKVLPLSFHKIIWAMCISSVLRGAVIGLVTFLVGSIFYKYQFGEFLEIKHPLILIYFVVLAGLVFGHLGISTAFWAKNFDQISAVSAFVLLPLTYLGGVFISIEHLSPFWQGVSKLNPLLYFINGIRYSILGVSDVAVGKAAAVAIGSLVIFHLLAQVSVRKASFHRW